ncbi:hypothetical protein FA13DRAFT_204199 [Coprinellus micaceus]|uniref:Uncharacterized protein n=1 Tax=Coprinellus micaceus TaxID=71717 RepID=A0A4Y7SG29_COPMI|nr:hypothetical protein FA13DRAFT_204199 [Coprinellus micaceus]
MASENPRDPDGEPPLHPSTAPNPAQADLVLEGRLHLSKAFKCLLYVLPLPVLSGILGFWNIMTFFMQPGDRPRLCSLTPRHCDILLSLTVFVIPTTIAFAFVALFYLDRLLSVSPIFDPSKPSAESPPDPDTVEEAGGNAADNEEVSSGGDNQGVRRVVTVLRFFIGTCYTLGTLSAIASVVAIVNASLVAKLDSPWSDGPEDKLKYKERVVLGYGEAVVEALLAYFMGATAITLSVAKRAVDARDAESRLDGQEPIRTRLSRSWSRFMQEHWYQRSALDRAMLSLLVSIILSFVSFIFAVVNYPFSHLRNIGDTYYLASCFLTLVLSWPALLVVHSHRSSGSILRAVALIATFTTLILLGTLWFIVSSVYGVLWVCSLFCDHSTPIPPTSICLYVRSRGVWSGFVAVLLGYLQAGSVGAAAWEVWEARSGIRLGEDEGQVEES